MQDKEGKAKDPVKRTLVISIIAGSILCVALTVVLCMRAVYKADIVRADPDGIDLDNPFGWFGSLPGNSGHGSGSGNTGGSGSFGQAGNGGSSGSGSNGSQGAGQGQSGGTIPYDLDEEDDYLMAWAEHLDEDVPYDIVWSFDSYESVYGNVSWTYSYYYLEQKGADYSAVNEAIRNTCGYVTHAYLQNYGYDDPNYQGSLQIAGNAYIAYNTPEKISVYAVHVYTEDGTRWNEISSANIDLATGEVFENTDIFMPDLAFAERFRLQSNRQNGSIDFLDQLTDDQILELLTDDDTNILFFTQKGMEVGFHYDAYLNGNRQSGYVTITVNDYQKYLNDGQKW